MSSFFNPKEGDEFETTLNAALKRLEEQAALARLIRITMEESLELRNGDNKSTNGTSKSDKPADSKKDTQDTNN